MHIGRSDANNHDEGFRRIIGVWGLAEWAQHGARERTGAEAGVTIPDSSGADFSPGARTNFSAALTSDTPLSHA
jgi:hypothetical protein